MTTRGSLFYEFKHYFEPLPLGTARANRQATPASVMNEEYVRRRPNLGQKKHIKRQLKINHRFGKSRNFVILDSGRNFRTFVSNNNIMQWMENLPRGEEKSSGTYSQPDS